MAKQNLPTQNVDEIVNQITSVWNKAAEYIIEVATILHRYQSDRKNYVLWKEIRQSLIDKKIMNATVISNLTNIGANKLLTSNVDKLPNAYNTLYLLTTLPDEELKKGFKENLISPELTIDTARKWKKTGVTLDNDSGEPIDLLEIEIEDDGLLKSVILSFTKEDVIYKFEDINEVLELLKSKIPYADIKINGLLKRKIEGD